MILMGLSLVLAFGISLWLFRDICVASLVLIPIMVILGVMIVSPEKDVRLHNPNLGVRLQRRSLWGIELSYKWVTPWEPVPIDLELSQSLTYPPSITALPTELRKIRREQAVAILRVALIGLLAKRYIQIFRCQSYEWRRWRGHKSVQHVYSVAAIEEFDQAQPKGGLERKIIGVLTNWSKQEGAKEWPDGPPIYNLVRAIYGKAKDNPDRWLAELVAVVNCCPRLGPEEGETVLVGCCPCPTT